MVLEIVAWCDVHMARDTPERVPGETHRVTLDGVSGELELCGECWAGATDALSAMLANAREVREDRPGKSGGKSGKRGPAVSKSTDPTLPPNKTVVCPVCDKPLSDRSTARSHTWARHTFDLNVHEGRMGQTLDGRTVNLWCGTCDAGYVEPKGLGAHHRTAGHTGRRESLDEPLVALDAAVTAAGDDAGTVA